MERYNTDDIFTPATHATYTFVDRPAINTLLVDGIRTKGKQLIIFGHSGTGKTTLLYNKLLQTYDDFIFTRCTSDLTFERLVLQAFDQLDNYFVSTKSTNSSNKINAKISADYKLIKASFGAARNKSNNEELSRVVPPQLTPQKLASFFGASNSCWVVDDFHKIEENEKKKLAQYMKVFMDESVNFSYVKIIAIGAVGTAKEVLQLDRELNNRVSEIEVPFMNREELLEIIAIGESKLNISISSDVKKKIVDFSTGLPAITHQLCLNLCFAKELYQTADTHQTFDRDDFRYAVSNYIITNSGYLHDRYEKAIEEVSEHSLPIYYHLLRCFVKSKKHNLTIKDVQKYFADYKHPQAEPVLEYLLNLLKKESRGSALDYDDPSKTWFIPDPFFRVYCICAMDLTFRNLQAQYELFQKESVEKSKKRLKKEQLKLVQEALKSGSYFDF